MKLQMLQDLKNHGPSPPISYNTKPSVVQNKNDKIDSLKVYINTHPG